MSRYFGRVQQTEIKKIGGRQENFIKVDGDRDFTVFTKLNDDEFSSYRFSKDNNDDFVKMYEISVRDKNFIKKFDITHGESNKIFAFEVSNGTDREWFPEHSSVPTSFIGGIGYQTLYADGKEVNISSSNSRYIPFNNAEFSQVMECSMSSDAEVRAILKLTTTVGNGKTDTRAEMKFLLNTSVPNAYIFQVPLLNDFMGQVKSDKYEVVEADTENLGTNSYFNDKDVKRLTATSNVSGKEDYFIETTIDNTTDPLNNLFVQHRSDGVIQKIYPKSYSQAEFEAGDVIYWEGGYRVGKTPRANRLYS